MDNKFVINGKCAPGYEPVREKFRQHFLDGMEQCAQVCVYVRGVVVVDLWGARIGADKKPKFNYGPGSTQNVFSSSKAVASLVIAMLVDRGHLEYNQLVSDIWPEYAKNGKEGTRIGHITRHEAGLWAVETPINVKDLTSEGLKRGAVSKQLEDQSPSHVPGEKREYHALSRGFLLNEIVRRVDPQQRTIGEFIREEIARPLGISEELRLGIEPSKQDGIAPLTNLSIGWTYLQFLLPRLAGGGRIPTSPLARLGIVVAAPVAGIAIATGLVKLPEEIQLPEVEGYQGPAGGGESAVAQLFNHELVRQAEMPSANMHCSGRALAKVAATIVEGGEIPGGQRLLSRKGVEEALARPVKKGMFYGLWQTYFTNAGWNLFKDDRYGYCGWLGLGGSVLQWHQKERIGFGYAMNSLEQIRTDNWRGAELQRCALECAKATRHLLSSRL